MCQTSHGGVTLPKWALTRSVWPDSSYLLVLPPVEDSPGDLPGVPPHEMRLEALALQELEGLAIRANQGAAPAGVDLVPAVTAQVDPEIFFYK